MIQRNWNSAAEIGALCFAFLMLVGCVGMRRHQIPFAPPPPPPPSPAASISVNPDSINRGDSVTLNWQTENAAEVSISHIGPVASSGTEIVKPAESTTYKLAARGPGGTAEAIAMVSVHTPTPSPTIACTATPDVVVPGQTVTIECSLEPAGGQRWNYHFSASRGQPISHGAKAVLDTAGLGSGSIEIDVSVSDDRNAITSTRVEIDVGAAAPPPEPQKAGLVDFRSGSAYITHAAEAVLDGQVLSAEFQAQDKMLLIGFYKPPESSHLGLLRARRVKQYLTSKGIDETRLVIRSDSGDRPKLELWHLPPGTNVVQVHAPEIKARDFAGRRAKSHAPSETAALACDGVVILAYPASVSLWKLFSNGVEFTMEAGKIGRETANSLTRYFQVCEKDPGCSRLIADSCNTPGKPHSLKRPLLAGEDSFILWGIQKMPNSLNPEIMATATGKPLGRNPSDNLRITGNVSGPLPSFTWISGATDPSASFKFSVTDGTTPARLIITSTDIPVNLGLGGYLRRFMPFLDKPWVLAFLGGGGLLGLFRWLLLPLIRPRPSEKEPSRPQQPIIVVHTGLIREKEPVTPTRDRGRWRTRYSRLRRGTKHMDD